MELYLAVTARDSDAVRHLVRDGKHNIEELYEVTYSVLHIEMLDTDDTYSYSIYRCYV